MNAILIIEYTDPTPNPKASLSKLLPTSVVITLVSTASLYVFSVESPAADIHLQVLDHLNLFRDDVKSAYWLVGSSQGWQIGGATTGWIGPLPK